MLSVENYYQFWLFPSVLLQACRKADILTAIWSTVLPTVSFWKSMFHMFLLCFFLLPWNYTTRKEKSSLFCTITLNIKKKSLWKRSSEYTSLSLFCHELHSCLVIVSIPVAYNNCVLNFTYSMFYIYITYSLSLKKFNDLEQGMQWVRSIGGVYLLSFKQEFKISIDCQKLRRNYIYCLHTESISTSIPKILSPSKYLVFITWV